MYDWLVDEVVFVVDGDDDSLRLVQTKRRRFEGEYKGDKEEGEVVRTFRPLVRDIERVCAGDCVNEVEVVEVVVVTDTALGEAGGQERHEDDVLWHNEHCEEDDADK